MADWFSALISGGSGLGGVYLGAWLTGRREERARDRDSDKRGAYLAIVIGQALDRFTAGCAAVVRDEGLDHGEQGYRHAQVDVPIFDPSVYDVDWQAIPATLAEAVLSLPGRIEEAREKISDTYEFVADPPDFDEYFQERQLQYAGLGLYAARTAAALRSHAKLPLRLDRGWDVEAYLTAQQAEIESRRRLNARLRAESFASFGHGDTPL